MSGKMYNDLMKLNYRLKIGEKIKCKNVWIHKNIFVIGSYYDNKLLGNEIYHSDNGPAFIHCIDNKSELYSYFRNRKINDEYSYYMHNVKFTKQLYMLHIL